MENIDDVSKSLWPAKEKWEKIGLGLGLTPDTIQQIQTEKESDHGQCLYATLHSCIRQTQTARLINWRTLLRVLKSKEVDEAALAEYISKEKGWPIS